MRNTSHVNVGEQFAPVRVGGDRANAKRRPETLPIHNCRTSKPSVAPRGVVETIDRIERAAPMAKPQQACIIRSNINDVFDSHTAGKLELAGSHSCPFAAWCAPLERMSSHEGERTAAS